MAAEPARQAAPSVSAPLTARHEIVWLGEPHAEVRGLVGGKVAPLSRLAARYRVPGGFCLTTDAHQLAVVGGHALPASLQRRVAEAYGRLAEQTGQAQPSVAVRSSAVDEDGAETSFAGQHDTYLNVIGAEAVGAAIVRCWESARAPRVLEYRRQHGLATDGASIAVLVQQLVVADVSGVVFSANPLTGNRDEVVVNASWGLGESVVGGSVTPDTFVVRATGDPAGWQVTVRTVAEKRKMTVAVAGGTREVDVPRLMARQPSLSDAQLREMAGLARDLEATMGWPVDIECAYRDDVLYLLQCRPITTLAAAGR
ncbi:MAG: PEP/pyruvate-binding domain-containing protein [Chloroflexi bacterium]|nr:PEP/pyruvate-binding domain-containing protein [Chloroflexota bacterium]